MDVRCTRCGTEYEFDDALISERGTSVRCTQCSYQFRVFPPEAKSVGPDEWVVLTNLGRRVVYRTLRELQNGIARGEVAREDLLARGSAPPRPLGSIAELDPLFATKAAPDKKSSTLTGVAPPADGGRKRASADSTSTAASVPTEEAGALRAQHDTWSGVAPQAKITDLAELAARPSPPMRVSGSRTVLGIGSPEASVTREPPPPVRAPAQSPEGRADMALQASVGDSSGGNLSLDPSENFSEPPKTRSFESGAPIPPEETRPLLGDGLTVPLAIAEGSAASHQPGDSEPPTLPPPPSGLGHQRIGTSLGLGIAANPGPSEPATSPSTLADSAAVATKPLPFGTAAQPLEAPRAGGEAPPLERDAAAVASGPGSAEPAGEPVPVPAAEASQDSLEPRTLISESALQRPAQEAPPARRIGSAPRHARPVAAEVGRPDAVTRPPSRPHPARPSEKPANRTPAGIILFAVVLLGGAGWVGMKLTSLKLDKPQTEAAPSAVVASAPKTDSMTLGVDSARPAEAASPLTPVDEALEAGDADGALGLLEGLDDSLKTTKEFTARRATALSNSIDLLYWQLRLTRGAQASAEAELQQTLQKRLATLAQLLDECRKDDDCKLRTQPAFWALCRMQQQPERAQPPKQGTVDANGLYQLAMLDWSQAKTPDKKTLDRLTKARLTGVVQGPRVTALIVALIDNGRLVEAKTELEQLGTQPKAHPHLELLNAYYRAAAQSPDGGVAADTASGESADMDAFLREPDFRVRLQRAVQCLSRGEVTKATKLFRSVLAERPNDTEAITGMGDIHRRKSDFAGARTFYDRALTLNGNYLPAMVGAADVRWQSGDRAAAVGFYKRIVERVGEGPGYGQTASARIREFEGARDPGKETGKEIDKSKAPADGKPKDDPALAPAVPGNAP